MTDTPERALLRRLVAGWSAARFDDSFVAIIEEANALLAQPAPEGFHSPNCSAVVDTATCDCDRTPPAARVEALVDNVLESFEEWGNTRGREAKHAAYCTFARHRAALLAAYRPLPRAEAEAMVEAHCHAIREHGVYFTEETRIARDKARAALLRALTGEGT